MTPSNTPVDPAGATRGGWLSRLGDDPAPLTDDDGAGLGCSTDEDERESYADLTGVRVLVVDDEADIRELFVLLLESCGAEVRSASSAAEAFAALRGDPPHVLVSDIAMPLEDGFSLMRRVRALSASEGGAVPSVAVTAFTFAEHRARALDAGFTQHVGKPFEPEQLVAMVRQLSA